MRTAFVLLLGVTLGLGSVACKKANNAERDREAIRVAIEKYLSERSNLNRAAMDVKIGQVTMEGNTAQAQVEFQAKGSEVGGFTMQMEYQLERQGEGWVVRSSRARGEGPSHPAGGTPMPPTAGPSEALPPGHAPVGNEPATRGTPSGSSLPAGHPPIGQTNTPAKKTPAPPKK